MPANPKKLFLFCASALIFVGFVHSRYPLLSFSTSTVGMDSMPAAEIPMDASGLTQEHVRVDSMNVGGSEIPMDASGLIQKRIKVDSLSVFSSTDKGSKTATDRVKDTIEAEEEAQQKAKEEERLRDVEALPKAAEEAKRKDCIDISGAYAISHSGEENIVAQTVFNQAGCSGINDFGAQFTVTGNTIKIGNEDNGTIDGVNGSYVIKTIIFNRPTTFTQVQRVHQRVHNRLHQHLRGKQASRSDGPVNGTGENLTLHVRTSNWGYENSWYIAGCYLQDTGGVCAGGAAYHHSYANHRFYSASCYCPGKTVVQLTCMCSYGDGWHGGYIAVQENGKKYCAGFSHGYSKREYVVLGAITTTTTTCVDISGLYGHRPLYGYPNQTRVLFLRQSGCFGSLQLTAIHNHRSYPVRYPYTASGHQLTVPNLLTFNITGMPGAYELVHSGSQGVSVFTKLPNPVHVNHIYDNPVNYTCDIVFGDNPCLFNEHCRVEPNCPTMHGHPVVLLQTGSDASSDASFNAGAFLGLGEVESIDALSKLEGLEHVPAQKAWSTSSRRRNSPKEGSASPKNA
mmetsp:Transcript_51454/g.96395  ORF Transcript_51454/g.96395 Transcript_51454/m.96395 type:complete len:568 (+) Transcript_51454:75-1778(+)